MATGITIDEVTNTLDDIQGTEKIPVSSGISEPEVVTTGDLKDYINDGMQEEISDLSTIRSGASAGATAYQKPSSGIPSTDLASAVQTSLGKADTALQSFTETDPTVPSWAKSSSKPSYNYSEISGTPTLANVATSGSYNDLDDKPTIPTVPTTLSSFTDDLGSSPTHTHSQYLTSAPVTSVNGQTGAVSLTLGDANVIETVKVNGSALTPDANKAVDITVPSVSGKEDTTNKVTSLSSSSTDTQYPSAKCVWDLVGDIETLLAAI